MKIICIGASHFDVKAQLIAPLKMQSSNPATTFFSKGGVIRNVAENLGRLSLDVNLVSLMGRDAKSDHLLQLMQELGVNVDRVLRSDKSPTGTYTAILDQKGELILALADIGIYDEMKPSYCKKMDLQADYWMIDSSFPEETLRWLCLNCPQKTKLWAMAISPVKVIRWKTLLSHLDLLFLNHHELSALVKEGKDPRKKAKMLLKNGPKAVIVSEGEKGAFYLSCKEEYFSCSAEKVEVVDVTGAGDALAAGVLFGKTQGLSMQESLLCGLKAAALTIGVKETVCPTISPQALMSAI